MVKTNKDKEVKFDESEVEEIVNQDSATLIAGEEITPTTVPVFVKKYEGKIVVSEGSRVVNDVMYNYVILEDGSRQDLTVEDYETKVIVSEQ